MDKDNDSVIPGMKPSQDDIALRQKQLQRRTGNARPAGTGPAQKAAVTSSVNVSPSAQVGATTKTSSVPLVLTLLLVLLAAAVAGYALWQNQQLQQQLKNAEIILQKQSDNLNTLNERLSATGETANLSVDALKVMLKDHDLEIRKLWDLANKRNRGNIANNEKAISDLRTSLTQLTRTQSSSVAQQQKNVADLEQKLSASLAADVNALTQRVTRAEAAAMNVPASVELRIAQNSEAIRSIESKAALLESQIGQGSGGSADLVNIKLEIEDIQIRLDRMQNALSAQ